VLLSAVLSFLLGVLMAEAASRRGDARVLLVALAFLASSGFLALHALATPGVPLAGKNAGSQIASAIGLMIAPASRRPRHSSSGLSHAAIARSANLRG
jgi:adenylate cyclase